MKSLLSRWFTRKPSQKSAAAPDTVSAFGDSLSAADMAVEPSTRHQQSDPGPATRSMIDDVGLPPVVKRAGMGKLVHVLGLLAVVAVGGALVVAANAKREPTPKRKQAERQEVVMNNLPPLVVPPPPPLPVAQRAPVATAALQAEPINAVTAAPGQEAMHVIPLAPAGVRRRPGSGGPVDWLERKMDGSVLANGTSPGGSVATSGPPRPVLPDAVSLGSGTGLAGPQRNELAARLEPTEVKATSAALLQDRNFLITKGTTLDCALETALDSTLPGLTSCRLTRDVYSDNGNVLLLERGSQLVGEYQGGVKHGQARLFVLWTRAKTPRGVVISLNSPGIDALGRTGLEGWVDSHFAERFGAAILLSLIQDSLQALVAKQQEAGATNVYSNSAESGSKVIEKTLEASVNIPPTLSKLHGEHIQVMVARDLDFASVYTLKRRE